jgi:hypothetical protein
MKFRALVLTLVGLLFATFPSAATAGNVSGGVASIVSADDLGGERSDGFAGELAFDMAKNLTLGFGALKSDNDYIYSIGITPNWKLFEFPVGVSYVDLSGDTGYGAFVGAGLYLFRSKLIGLRFNARYHVLHDDVASYDSYVDARGMVSINFGK